MMQLVELDREQAGYLPASCAPKVIAEVARHYDLTPEDMAHPKYGFEGRLIHAARSTAAFMMRKLLGFSYQRIATYFNVQDHSTTMNMVRQVRKKAESEGPYAKAIMDFENELRVALEETGV